MNDVESFEVLKDAASAAIYGREGANGVILITTKTGKEGKTKFSYVTHTRVINQLLGVMIIGEIKPAGQLKNWLRLVLILIVTCMHKS
jgi:TonB-dependent SusC/RagA subfamily outer membrane receptor